MGLSACFAPAPCSDDSDCPVGECQNGACPAPVDALDRAVDMTAPTDDGLDAADRAIPPPDGLPIDAARDASVDQALDAADARPDAALADMQVDAAQPCEMNVELNILRPRMDVPMARGEVFGFEIRVNPAGAEVNLSAPYGEFQRNGMTIEWAPRGGNPGDLPWPWWTGPVELTVAVQQGTCRVEERFDVNVTGDVLVFDEADDAIWVLGSDGQLFGQWIELPGNGVTAMAHAGAQELLAAVRQPNASGHHLIHRLNTDGEIINTLATEDFGTGGGLLLGPARSIQVLPNGLITASSMLETSLPFWSADGRLSHQLEVRGPISSLGRLGARAIFSIGDMPQINGTDGAEALVEIGRNAIVPQAIFELHDATQFLAVAGGEWNILVRYSMGEFANLVPPPPGSDVRAVTRFRDGYLVYDFRNRRLRNYDAGFEHQVVPGFAPDVRQISVAGLLWLDRRQRIAQP